MTIVETTVPESSLEQPESIVSIPLLMYGLSAGPLAWISHLILNAVLAGYGCRLNEPNLTAQVWPQRQIALISVDAAALIMTCGAGIVSLYCWRMARNKQSPARDVIQIGENRTRFIAACGLLASAGFLIAILFDTYAAIMVPECFG